MLQLEQFKAIYSLFIPHSKSPWQQLNSKKNEIRILTLLPAQSSSDDIHCQLQIVFLQDQPEYEALSYVWGHSSDSRHIFLNEKKIIVTNNLFDALTRIRGDQEARTLWVNAICTNQNDDKEKNIQVMMMGQIYSQVFQVLAWLTNRENDYADMTDDIISCGHDQQRHHTKLPHTLFVLVAYEWWRRAWTFQEATPAKGMTFYIGSKTFTHKDLEAYCNSLQRHLFRRNSCCCTLLDCLETFLNLHVSAMASLKQLSDSRQIIHQGKQGLLDLMIRNTDRASTNPRDKAYAYLGVAYDVPPDFVRYELPIEECIVHISTKLIQQSMSLEVIRHTGPIRTGDDKRMEGLPTWCPDWTTTTRMNESYETGRHFDILRDRFSASAQMKAAPFFPSSNILRVSGVLCDTVTHIGNVCDIALLQPGSDTRFFSSMGSSCYAKDLSSQLRVQ